MFPVTSSVVGVFTDVNQLSTLSVVMSSIDQDIGPLYPCDVYMCMHTCAWMLCLCACVCECVCVCTVCVCVCMCV